MAAQADYLSPFLQALTQGTEMVARLRQAADQQQQLAEKQRQFDLDQQLRNREFDQKQAQNDFTNRMALNQAGAQPVQNGRYTMPSPVGPGVIGPVPDGSIPVAQTDQTVPWGGQQYRLPSPEEQLARKAEEAKTLANAKSFQFSLPDAFADALGHPRGTTVTIEHPPTLGELAQMTNAAAPPAPPKKANKQVSYRADDRGTVTPLIFDPETGTTTPGKRIAGIDKTKAAADGGAGAGKPATRAEFERVTAARDADLSKSEAQLRKDLADPMAKTAQGVHAAYLAHAQRRADAQKKYEDSIAELTGHPVPHNAAFDNELAAIQNHPLAKNWKDATAPASQVPDGTTATGPGGKKLVRRGGLWVPAS